MLEEWRTHHPAPSWMLVATALYCVYIDGYGKYHKVLQLVKQKYLQGENTVLLHMSQCVLAKMPISDTYLHWSSIVWWAWASRLSKNVMFDEHMQNIYTSLMPGPRLSWEKRSGDPTQISWVYYWNVVRTNKIVNYYVAHTLLTSCDAQKHMLLAIDWIRNVVVTTSEATCCAWLC